jgi:hypothetical protein
VSLDPGIAIAVADTVPISVSKHAVSRYAERFASAYPELIEREVRECLRAGRISTRKPQGVKNADEPDCLYAWLEDGRRVYVLTPNRNGGLEFIVKTTLRV